MENNLLSKTFKIIHNSPKNLNNLSVEDPINKINQSLNNLLISLQNDNTPICKELNLDNENEEEISNYYDIQNKQEKYENINNFQNKKYTIDYNKRDNNIENHEINNSQNLLNEKSLRKSNIRKEDNPINTFNKEKNKNNLISKNKDKSNNIKY